MIYRFKDDMKKCTICGSVRGDIIVVRERQLNRGDRFTYFLCAECGTLQLIDDVRNMGDYYGSDYYSFHMKSPRMKIPRFFAQPVLKGMIAGIPLVNRKISARLCTCSYGLYNTHRKKGDRILDVGGGNGLFGAFWQKNYFPDVTVIDYFCQSSPYENIRYLSCQITDLSSRPQYDLITMNSSFEHMNNPREVLSKVKELLSNNGLCLIKIPLMGLAFELYHENWYQIDAPRHYYLYTVKAMRILCEEVGLEIKSIMYDSTGGQFYISEEYRETDLDLQEIISRYQGEKRSVKKHFERMAEKANRDKVGDMAWFYIGHSSSSFR